MIELYIYHHLGLGDHLICNSIIRYYSKLYDKIYLFVKNRNLSSVEFMYRDLKNISYIIGDDDNVRTYINNNIKKNFLVIGFVNFTKININFDEFFYLQSKLNFKNKWTNFHIERDIVSEKKLFDSYNLKKNEYIFVHDDKIRGYIIEDNLLPKDIKIIKPDIKLNNNFFDYIYIIENAKEIHCIDSSYLNLIDLLQIKNDLYFYKNRRNDKLTPILKLNWKIK